ncbi:MAG: Ger(x)C family spore germination protein [Firmicutes bacterium]|nr:Ger(x)C family spore germination protein [Bacillota bacterium]MCL5038387.1 Ger(x)C family spore germination protein [Bacillota bacterium]
MKEMDMKMKKIIILSFLSLALIILTGCWDRVEIEERAMVLGLGIDSGTELRLTYQFPLVAKLRPEGQDKGPGFMTKSCPGKTLGEAMTHLQQQIEEAVFLGQIRIIVFSEEAATRGVGQEIDFLRRDPMLRPQVFVLVTPGSAAEFLQSQSRTELVPSLALVKLITQETRRGRLPNIHLGEFMVRQDSPGVDPVAPVFHPAEGTFHWDGLAVFGQDRMVGRLDQEESLIFMRLRDGKRGGSVEVANPMTDGTVLIKFFHLMRRVRIEEEGGLPHFYVTLELEGNVGEFTGEQGRLPAPGRISAADVRLIEERAAQKVKKETEDLVRKVQREFGADIFGLGEWVRAYRPGLWRENWHEIFPYIRVDIEVKLRLRRYGMTGI